MFNKLILSTFILFTIHGQASTSLPSLSVADAQALMSQPLPSEIQSVVEVAPKEYSFFSEQGTNSVDYPKAVMHQVLINDSKLIFGSMNRGQYPGNFTQAYSKLNTYYDFDPITDSNKATLVKAVAETGGSFSLYEGQLYGDIYAGETSLKSVIAGNQGSGEPRAIQGWRTPVLEGVVVDGNGDGVMTTGELVQAFMTVIANNAASDGILQVANGSLAPQIIDGAHVTSSGLDLAQTAQKLLHGAVSLYQATTVHWGVNQGLEFSAGLGADNENFVEAHSIEGGELIVRPYTQLQHQWDMAFGYFGAARDYLNYSDQQVAKGYSVDSYAVEEVEDSEGNLVALTQVYGESDFEISLQAEKNMGLSINAAKRDLKAKLENEDMSFNAMDAFLKGRQLLQARPAGYMEYAQAYAVLAAYQWERSIAATVVHYINKTIKDYQIYGTKDYKFTDLAKHFGEMKGFAFAFQFNPTSAMTDSDFIKMHELMGDVPVTPGTEVVSRYVESLLEARRLIAESFSFDPENAKAW